jgi:polar amino acid transport system substrate-binding protein
MRVAKRMRTPASWLRKAVLTAAMLVALAPFSGLAQTRQLRLGSTPWSPFTNAPGQPRLAIDLVHAALERVGIKADTTIVPEGALTPALVKGQFDGSPALWRDDQRDLTLFYSRPYLENRMILVGRRGSDVSATTFAALAGKRVALVEGFSYGDSVLTAKGTITVPSRSVEDSLQKVLAGEADYTLMDDLVIQNLISNHADQVRARLALGAAPLVVRSLHFALRRSVPEAQSIVDRFDAEIRRMIADHSYHRLLQLDWIEADVDGDGRVEAVPASDQVSQNAPDRRYQLLTTQEPASAAPPAPSQRFYVGGRVYEGWSSVPESYKVATPTQTASGTPVAPIFTFRW